MSLTEHQNVNFTNGEVEQSKKSAYSVGNPSSDGLLSVREYRDMLGDQTSTDKQIKKRLEYLEALCRNIIRLEIQNKNLKLTINQK